MKKILLFNILFFFVLICLFFVSAFAMGFVANNRYGTDAGILYLLMITIHLFLNYLLMHRQSTYSVKRILYVSSAIICIYLLLLFH